jgi:hypothetical protein
MGLQIEVGVDDVMPKVKGCILGPSGIGKTSQLLTLPPKSTLLVDLEAGSLSVRDWLKAGGNRLDVFKEAQRLGLPVWEMARNIACWAGGPSPLATEDSQPYSRAHYAYVCSDEMFGSPKALDKYDLIFVDSITVASRASFTWAQTQPEAFSEKTGKPDTRGAYGLLKKEMVNWLTQFQHIDKSAWMVGILDETTDDFNRKVWKPQVEGTGTMNAMPGIFDQVVSMVEIDPKDGTEKYRAFVCHTLNEWGFPAKDRSRCLDVLEPPDLGALMAKIAKGAPGGPLNLSMPAGSAAGQVPKS